MTIQELYPNAHYSYGYFSGIDNYEPIINQFGEIIYKTTDFDYYTDTRIIYKKDDKYGLLIFGDYGISYYRSYEELENCMNKLRNDIVWFNDVNELLYYFKNNEWFKEYDKMDEETIEFIIDVVDMFNPEEGNKKLYTIEDHLDNMNNTYDEDCPYALINIEFIINDKYPEICKSYISERNRQLINSMSKDTWIEKDENKDNTYIMEYDTSNKYIVCSDLESTKNYLNSKGLTECIMKK